MKIPKIYPLGFHRANKGQAMTEFCVAVPLLVLLWWSLIYMTDMFIAKHETLVAARYGTWLLSRHDNIPKKKVDIDQVTKSIQQYYFKNKAQGLQIFEQHAGGDEDDDSGFQEELESESGSGSDDVIDGITGFIGDNLMGTDTPNLYSLKVQYDFPRLFGAVDLREDSNENYPIVSEHFIIGNSWDGQRVTTHDIVDMLGEIITEIF